MRYIIKGKGGQGVLFLSKVIANALLLSGLDDFSFLKEFDEGQRNGEIKVTFTLPFGSTDKKLIVKEQNMIELREAVKDLSLNNDNVKKALKIVEPKAFKKNLEIWQNKIKK